MKFLYVYGKYTAYDVPWALTESGYDANVLADHWFDPLNPAESDAGLVEQALTEDHYDCVISQLFIPQVSDACENLGVLYISWTYDSPLLPLFTTTVYNSCNRIFIFDYKEYERLKKCNVPHVYYLTLAANTSRTGGLTISEEDERRFSSDISFVGTLYEINSYNKVHQDLPPFILEECNQYLTSHLCSWEQPKQWYSFSDLACQFFREKLHMSPDDYSLLSFEEYLGLSLLSRKLGEMDRVTVLNTLAGLHSVDLYTKSDASLLNQVQVHPPVDFLTELSKVFYLSKINLNITLPSIESGLPQRIFDIMGSGGFVLTNWQPELEWYFKPGVHLETYRSLDELIQKIAYYLSHEKERIQIAMNGYQEIRRKHTYHRRIEQILSMIQEEEP